MNLLPRLSHRNDAAPFTVTPFALPQIFAAARTASVFVLVENVISGASSSANNLSAAICAALMFVSSIY